MGVRHENNPLQIVNKPDVSELPESSSISLSEALRIYLLCKGKENNPCDGCQLVGYAGVGQFGDICEVFTELDTALLSETS